MALLTSSYEFPKKCKEVHSKESELIYLHLKARCCNFPKGMILSSFWGKEKVQEKSFSR